MRWAARSQSGAANASAVPIPAPVGASDAAATAPPWLRGTPTPPAGRVAPPDDRGAAPGAVLTPTVVGVPADVGTAAVVAVGNGARLPGVVGLDGLDDLVVSLWSARTATTAMRSMT